MTSLSPMELTAVPCSPPLALHGEGPFWSAETGRLGWVDIPAGRLWLAVDDGSVLVDTRSYDVGRPLGAAVPARAGGWVLALGAGFGYLPDDGAPHGGRAQVIDLATVDDPDRVRMNDGKCDPVGRFWAGTMAYDASPDAGAFYRLGLNGEIDTILPNVTISNGLGWSPDRRTMYYIDTPTGRIDAFDYDAANGRVSRRRPVVEVDPESTGQPDGMTVDDEGCLWVAMWGGGRVCRYSPEGQLLATVRLPVTNVSSCCFGGADGRTLFMTTSRLELTAPEPDAGRIFRVDAGVSGPPAAAYGGPLPT